MKKYCITSILLCCFIAAFAQAETGYFKQNNSYDLSLSSNLSQHVGALGWSHLHGIGKGKKRFSIGYGLRLNSSFGGKKDFITAPGKLTSGVESPLIIFSEYIPGNFDTLSFSHYNTNSLNAVIHLNYAILHNLNVEFNIDALGFSFGKAQTADYTTTKRLQSPNTSEKQAAKPTPFNVLLVSDNDIGNLNSEILAKYWFNPHWAVKAGGTFIFSEYTTTNKLFLDNTRFRNKAFMPMIGISYSPFRE